MRRHLAGEGRVLLPDPVLDERVADPVDKRDAAIPLDRLGDRPARANVVDDLGAGLLRENRLRQQRRHEVAGDELAFVVDEEATVGVAVVRDAEVGALLDGHPDDELAVLREERVRLVVRERPVRLEVERDRLDREPIEDGLQHRPAHSVRRVDDHAQRLQRAEVDEGQHLVDEAGPDVLGPDLAAAYGRAEAGQRAVAHVEEARVPADGKGAAADDLHPRVLLRVVRRGDGDAAVETERADGVVDHLRPDQPDVEDVGAAVGRALDRRGLHLRRHRPHVAPDRDPPRLELLDVGAADRVRALLVEFVRVDPADVVRLEHLRIEHARMLA